MFQPLPKKTLHFRQKMLDLSTPKIMGVLNVTPDSFSDGGRFNTTDKALSHVKNMLDWGVDVIDIGGESTRPNAPVVSTDEELDRVIPVVKAIRKTFGDEPWLSLDTSCPVVMQAGIQAGADMVNDVRGLTRQGATQMVAQLNCPVVIMHSRGTPDEMTKTMNALTDYHDVVSEVIDELAARVHHATQAGINIENIIIDVGMGFAKNHEHHVALMQNLDKIITHFNLPMLFGVSRKRFLGEILSTFAPLAEHTPTDRDTLGTLAHFVAIQQGASMVRVHDVAKMAQAVKLWSLMNQR